MTWFCFITSLFTFLAPQELSNEREPPDEILWHTVENSEPWPVELVTDLVLPKPPPNLAPTIADGKVEFKFYDTSKLQRQFTGETRMAAKYRLDFKFDWKVTRESGRRWLDVTIEHRPTTWEWYHQVLLPSNHASPDMFSLPLTLHELDHVRVTLDPRFPALFDQWLQESTKTFRIELKRQTSQREFDSLIHAEMQVFAEKSFARLVQLIQVRSQELDRLTNHGLQPLPADFFKDR